MIHVIPINDDVAHIRDVHCWCEPRVLDGVCTHDAADCRQQVERLIGEGVAEDKQWGVFED